MTIQTIVERTGLTKRMIRHYEELGLVCPKREQNEYRSYSEEDVNQLLCIKALKEIGFSLAEISKILAGSQTEEVLKLHLKELFLKKQEIFSEQKENVGTIKRLLGGREVTVYELLNRIAHIHAPNSHFEGIDDLHQFSQKHHVVRGNIKAVVDFSKIAVFGVQDEFRVCDLEYTTYRHFFENESLDRANIASCKELYARLLFFTEASEAFDGNFHRDFLRQFEAVWKSISWPLSLHLEAITDEMTSLEDYFCPFDLAVILVARNDRGERIKVVLPGQPLIVYLSQKDGVSYNDLPWTERGPRT